VIFFPSVLWHCWLGDRKGIKPVKSWVLVCWWWHSDWGLYLQLSPPPQSSLAPLKSRYRDILVTANPGPPGKWLLKRRRRSPRLM